MSLEEIKQKWKHYNSLLGVSNGYFACYSCLSKIDLNFTFFCKKRKHLEKTGADTIQASQRKKVLSPFSIWCDSSRHSRLRFLINDFPWLSKRQYLNHCSLNGVSANRIYNLNTGRKHFQQFSLKYELTGSACLLLLPTCNHVIQFWMLIYNSYLTTYNFY